MRYIHKFYTFIHYNKKNEEFFLYFMQKRLTY